MQLRNGWVGGLLLMGACSLALDPEKKQCSDDAECGLTNGKPLYSCVDNYCESISCSADSECQERGGFVCEANKCAEAECLQDANCSQPGQICTAGRCVDPVFGCFNQKQPLTSSDPAVLEVKILIYGNQEPVTNFGLKVCSSADLACNTPIKVTHSYDTTSGVLRVMGLENGKRYGLRFTGTDSTGYPLQEAEYYMQRPVVGNTIEADKLEMLPELFALGLGESAGVPVDVNQALVLAQIFGCDNKPLAGVSLEDNRGGSLFYITGVPNPNTTETDSGGVGGFVNMEVNAGGAVQHKLTFSYGSSQMFAFTVAPRPKVLTFVQVYLGDYGSTIDRSENAPIRR